LYAFRTLHHPVGKAGLAEYCLWRFPISVRGDSHSMSGSPLAREGDGKGGGKGAMAGLRR